MRYVYNNTYNWKPVEKVVQTKRMLCPRCHNAAEFFLAWDGNGIGIPGLFTFATSKVYAYKCPICPAYEEVSAQVAKAIMNEQ
jgi:ribosomal protein S27AE